MNTVEVKNLNYSIDEKKILKNINFNINDGEYLSILGSNGSGKSTLALILAGLIKLDSKDSLFSKEKIAIVLENPDNQIIGTTVVEDIAFGLQNLNLARGEMETKINYVLDKMKIKHLKNREVISLSGGEKQKLAVVSLIALNYKIYIFDEVTSMLDPGSKKMMINLINELVNEGKTVIQITHFIEEAKLSPRSIVINDGEIVFDGETPELLNDKKILKDNRLI